MVARETLLRHGLSSLGVPDPTAREAIPRLLAYAQLLKDIAISQGYMGPGEHRRIVERHILESAALQRFLPAGELVDVGSGAGLPGIVLATIRFGTVTIVEAQKARAAFVRRAISVLDLGDRVDVVVARAEDAARSELRESAMAVTARALAELPVAFELTLPFARLQGRVVASAPAPGAGAALGVRDSDAERPLEPMPGAEEPRYSAHRLPGGTEEVAKGGGAPISAGGIPSSAPDAPESGHRAAELLGGGPPRRARFAVPGSEEARWVVIVDKLRPTPDLYPRRTGVPARRPLGR
jgi:16S rRNA G527 N7-methylase RsmG